MNRRGDRTKCMTCDKPEVGKRQGVDTVGSHAE